MASYEATMDIVTQKAAPMAQFDEFHRRGRELLHKQTRALDHLIHDLHLLDKSMTNSAVRLPLLMLQAAGVSVHSVLALTEKRDMAIRDAFGIARAAVETTVNAAYISVEGDKIAEKAVRHMQQKRWRDMNRRATIGSYNVSVTRGMALTPESIPGLKDALDEYTNKRGREVRDWVDLSIENRIDIIGKRCSRAGLCLAVALFTIYRPSSELLHGTYYGVNYFWQGSRSEAARSREAFDELWVMEHFATLLSSLFFSISGATEVIALVNGLSGHSHRQDELAEVLSALVEEMEQQA